MARWREEHRPHFWERDREDRAEGEPAVRAYTDAVRDALRRRGVLAVTDRAIGAFYVIDAQREKPGYVVWSVSGEGWSGSLADAREILWRSDPLRSFAPGASEAYADASRRDPGEGTLLDALSGGPRMRAARREAVDRVYGPGGTGMRLVEYPKDDPAMHDSIPVTWNGVDIFDPDQVARRMVDAMTARRIRFSGTPNIPKGDAEQTPVEVTPELIARWRTLAAEGATWRGQRIGGTSYHLPSVTGERGVGIL